MRKSYGTAFVDVVLDARAQGRPLAIEFEGAQDGDAQFSLQIWRLLDSGPRRKPRPVPEEAGGPRVLGTVGPGARLVYTVPSIDLTEFKRIGLIITRADADEALDPVGQYTIRLLPREDAEDSPTRGESGPPWR
jgi:hypothetical protein